MPSLEGSATAGTQGEGASHGCRRSRGWVRGSEREEEEEVFIIIIVVVIVVDGTDHVC